MGGGGLRYAISVHFCHRQTRAVGCHFWGSSFMLMLMRSSSLFLSLVWGSPLGGGGLGA